MTRLNDLQARFGEAAASQLASLLAPPPGGDAAFCPAPRDRCRGAMIGLLAGEALPAVLAGERPAAGVDAGLTLMTADAVLASISDHPAGFARRLAATNVRGAGDAAERAQANSRAGLPWWQTGAANSAGAGAAARSAAFGLLWAEDPRRAAYEAALSAVVTHGHPAAVAGAAAFAAATALAASGTGPLDRQWLADVAEICAEYPQGDVGGTGVAETLRTVQRYLDGRLDRAFRAIGRSAVVTEAVPAALLGAATAPDPSRWNRRAAAKLHPASRAMMGACIGARLGEAEWMDRDEAAPVAGVPHRTIARVRGIDRVLATADRIAGQRAEPVRPDPEDTEENASSSPVHVSFLIDRSGSMRGLGSDVVESFNGFVDGQRSSPGECSLTLVQFDSNDPYEVIHDAVPVDRVPDLTADQYQPRGATPLLDALGTLIEAAGTRLERLGHDEDQIVAVFTDGLENASRRWSRIEIFDLISARQEAGWTFVFMGANQDSYAEAGQLGMYQGSIQTFRADKRGVGLAFADMGHAVREYRMMPNPKRMGRKGDFFAGRKKAEADHEGRER